MSDQTQPQQPDQNKMLFINLLSTLAMSAMQQLGKIINPATGKTAVNLEAAQTTIDMLDMLDAKTSGNLDSDESKMMKETLTMLKLNYVETGKDKATPTDEGKKPAAAPEAAPRDATPAPPPGANDAAGAGAPTSASAQKSPPQDAKFHKSYG